MNSKKAIKITFPLILLVAGYWLGPAPEPAKFDLAFPIVPTDPQQLQAYVSSRENNPSIKPDNHARMIWSDSTKKKTSYSIVYLHGFSASQKEGDPVHRRLAIDFGFNLYLARLSDHGMDTTESLLDFTAEKVWRSAKEALAIGTALGEKVILVSTSTGSTLALKLAAEYPDKVIALINLSPNVAINDPAAFLLNDPWGLQIARIVMGGKYRVSEANEVKSKYWNTKYRLEAVVQLQELLERTMTRETFKKIKQPCLTLYYYKNETEQDPEVKVSAMLEMHDHLGTPDSLKVAKAIPSAEAHVIGSALVSKDVESVYQEMSGFLKNKLKLVPSPFALVGNL